MTSHKRVYKTIIIGAGASGLFCASLLKDEHLTLELSSEAGTKLSVSGGGRCNFTNTDMNVSCFIGNFELISSALRTFTPQDFISFVKSLGLEYEAKKRSQLFLKTSAKEFVKKLSHKAGTIKLNEKVLSIKKENGIFIVYIDNHHYSCENLVIASGGLSYPSLGVSSLAYDVAASFGHKIIPLKPALVGFTIMPSENWFRELSGVSLVAKIKVGDKIFVDDLLFTHKGLSGPIILNASLYHEKGFLEIDFIVNFDLKMLRGAKKISSVIAAPKRFIKAFLDANALEDKSCDKLTPQDLEIFSKIKSYKFAPAGTFGYTKAEITKGGIRGIEINPDNCESKLCKNLYFLGEALDVSGLLGGYNIHFAFATAALCAKQLNKGI